MQIGPGSFGDGAIPPEYSGRIFRPAPVLPPATRADIWITSPEWPLSYAQYLKKQNLEAPDQILGAVSFPTIAGLDEHGQVINCSRASSAARIGDVSESALNFDQEASAPASPVSRLMRTYAPTGSLIDVII